MPEPTAPDRRRFLTAAGAAALAGVARAADAPKPAPAAPPRGRPTDFVIACMTLPYSAFPLQRALTGIKAAGYSHVAWGVTHREPGAAKPVPVIAPDAPPATAKDLAGRCRDLGLEPVMMFATVYPDARDGLEVHTQRIRQAAAAGIPQVLTFSSAKSGGDRKVFVDRLKALGPVARDHGVLLAVKQHGGLTASGAGCAEILREVADDGVKLNYDAGNVMDYLKIDPLPDAAKCADLIRSFCIKDHRLTPRDQDCGPGLGEIDHYKLLGRVAFTGLRMPLCCENVFAPLLPRPDRPEDVDALARRAREFLDLVVRGLQA